MDATLHGDAADHWLAWIVTANQRHEVVWPDGYRARFAPKLEVLDPSGTVVLRDGDAVTGACEGPGGVLLLEPPFR